MQILSENIKKYIINNLDLEDEQEIKEEDINKIKDLNLNCLNSKMQEARFIPKELSYFKELEKCQFNTFIINDDIKINLEKLIKLNILNFEHCEIAGNKTLNNNIIQLYLNYSNFNFTSIIENKTMLKKLVLKDVDNVDINKICEFTNITELELLNCKIINSERLLKLSQLKKIKIIGCELDNNDIIENLNENVNITFSKKKFLHVG